MRSDPGGEPSGLVGEGHGIPVRPTRLIGWAQRRLLHYPAPMLMTALPDPVVRAAVGAAGGSVLAVEPDPSYGGHWRYTRCYLGPPRLQPA
jgi:hypothetical protein